MGTRIARWPLLGSIYHLLLELLFSIAVQTVAIYQVAECLCTVIQRQQTRFTMLGQSEC